MLQWFKILKISSLTKKFLFFYSLSGYSFTVMILVLFISICKHVWKPYVYIKILTVCSLHMLLTVYSKLLFKLLKFFKLKYI